MKVRIYARLITEFNHEILVDVQERTNIDNMLDEIEGKRDINRIDDFKAELEKYNCKIIEFIEDGSGEGEIQSDYYVEQGK